MERKLASIQRVHTLSPIKDADRIELAKVLGWQCAVKKGEFRKYDLGVYIEIDSVLPEHEAFSFMADKKYKVKVCKLKGVLSQGLLLPLEVLCQLGCGDIMEKGCADPCDPKRFQLMTEDGAIPLIPGVDVTNRMGVTHVDIPLDVKSANVIGAFPTFLVSKTDEMRLQAFPDLLEELGDAPICITEKLDGTSSTFAMHGDEFYMCGRNWRMDKDTYFGEMNEKYKIKEALAYRDGKIALQGEIVGPKVSGNWLELTERDVYFYSATDTTTRERLPQERLDSIALVCGLKVVPIIYSGPNKWKTVDEWIALSHGKSLINPNKLREGIVVRPLSTIYSQILLAPLSFKVVDDQYLLESKGKKAFKLDDYTDKE